MRCLSFASSMNYTLREYASDAVWRIKTTCNEMGIPHPTIVVESGRSLVAFHAALLFRVLQARSPRDLVDPTLSQQLSRLRYEGLVEFRRDGKNIHYRLASEEAAKVIEVLYGIYCEPVAGNSTQSQKNRRGKKTKASARIRAVPA